MNKYFMAKPNTHKLIMAKIKMNEIIMAKLTNEYMFSG
jgi:hypothetical protein